LKQKGNFTLAILRFGDFAILCFCDFLIGFAFGLAIWQFVLRFCNFAFGYRDFKNCDSWSLFLSHLSGPS